MRGRTLKNSFAILDEAQNATDTQIKMFLTRIGENSKIVINGDPTQIDLPNKKLSGLERSKTILGHLNEISIVDFDHKDVVRHPLVSKIVKHILQNKIMIESEVLVESKNWKKIIKNPSKLISNSLKKFPDEYKFNKKRYKLQYS